VRKGENVPATYKLGKPSGVFGVGSVKEKDLWGDSSSQSATGKGKKKEVPMREGVVNRVGGNVLLGGAVNGEKIHGQGGEGGT